MLKDPYGRPLLAIRAALTSKCNYRCFFCHMEGARGDEAELPPEDWKRIFEAASSLEIKEIKFTGGEPLLYKDLSKVLEYARESFSSVSMTTNGYFLEELWKTLADNEVRINLSLHSLDPERYKRITGVNGLEKVLRGLDKAIGNLDIKINFLALKGINEDEIWKMIEFCGERGIKLQLIEYEALLGKGDYYFSLKHVEDELERRALAIKVRRQHGKKVYFLPNQVEVLRTWRNSTLCKMCTRIRILSNGEAIPCIFRSNERVSLLEDPVEGIRKVNSLRRPYWRRSEVGMIDISQKKVVLRRALAEGFIKLGEETLKAIREGRIKKGDPLEVSRVAAMLAVKNTPQIIPHCHPIPIEYVGVYFEILEDGIKVTCEVKARAKTGVEMEALTGVSVALLTLWDMVKYLEKDERGQYPRTQISYVKVIEKVKGDGS